MSKKKKKGKSAIYHHLICFCLKQVMTYLMALNVSLSFLARNTVCQICKNFSYLYRVNLYVKFLQIKTHENISSLCN